MSGEAHGMYAVGTPKVGHQPFQVDHNRGSREGKEKVDYGKMGESKEGSSLVVFIGFRKEAVGFGGAV